MTSKRSWSAEDQAHALMLYEELGSREASARAGIPESTIRNWARRRGVRTRSTTTNRDATEAASAKAARIRAEMKLQLLERAVEVLDRIDQPHIDFRIVSDGAGAGSRVVEVEYPRPSPTGVREYAVAFGILLDKFRLENGEVTGRTAIDAPLQQWSDDEIAQQLGRVLTVLPGGRPNGVDGRPRRRGGPRRGA